MNITPVRIYINGNGSISFYGPNNTLITNLQNLNGAKQSNGQIIFDGDDKTISFYVYQLTSIESATFALTYSALDSRFFNPSVYSAKLNSVYQDVAEYVLVNKNGGASFVGGVVAVYPNYASFPATGQEAVIYIDEGTNQVYFWDGSAYQLLVSTGVQQYANFALFPVTGSANVIYIDMSTFEPYVWDGAAYVSLTDSATVAWGNITGVLSDQTDLQAALDDKVPYTGATGNVDLGEYELKAGQLTLDTSPTGTASVGTTQWNNSIGSSETTLKGGSVVLKNGVDLVARIVNKVTPNTTLTKAAYQAVRISGAAGQRLAVEFAQANNDNNSADTIGLVTETIPTNQEGFIMTVGNLEEINTTGSLQGETWADGDVLYLSPTTPGALTNVKPNGSNGHIVVMGYVEYAHAIHGKIYVKIMNGWELDELHNVYINAPTTWQVLRYDATAGYWTNSSLTASILPSGIDAAKIGAGTVDNTEFGYLNGVTSSIQTQLDGKFTLPSLTSGSVLFSNGTTIAQDNANLFWDDTNNRLGIGTATPSQALTIVSGGIAMTDSFPIRWGTSNLLYGSATGLDIASSAFAVRFRFTVGGNFLIGTTTDAGYKLDVNGTARVSGAMTFANSSSINASGNLAIGAFSIHSSFGFATFSNNVTLLLTGQTFTSTTGIQTGLSFTGGFAPTSGTATYSGFSILPTINQTGGANGITRGLYINPTLTAAADFRAIETTAGNVLFGASGTGFYWDNTNNRLGIGTASPAYALDVATDIRALRLYTNIIRDSNANAYINNTVTNAATTDISIGNATAASITLTSKAAGKFVFTTGNVLIGTTTDAGYKLDVNGTAKIQTSLTLGDLSGASPSVNFANASTQIFFDGTNGGLNFRSTFGNTTAFRFRTNSDLPNANTTGTNVFLSLPIGYAPTSGTGTWTQLSMTPTINQTGGANGITRGLYINPTLTSAANFRAIETARGNVVFGNLPTSSAGLPTGAIWNDGGTLKIV